MPWSLSESVSSQHWELMHFPDSWGSCLLFNQMISLTDAIIHFILAGGPPSIWFYIHNKNILLTYLNIEALHHASMNSFKYSSARAITRFNSEQECFISWMKKKRETESLVLIHAWIRDSETCCSVLFGYSVSPSSWALSGMYLCAKLEKARNEFCFEIFIPTGRVSVETAKSAFEIKNLGNISGSHLYHHT